MTFLKFCYVFFFFNDTATTEIYTLSLHDALPILTRTHALESEPVWSPDGTRIATTRDRKSTRLNSSHPSISYAVFCLKKKKKSKKQLDTLCKHDHHTVSKSYTITSTVRPHLVRIA